MAKARVYLVRHAAAEPAGPGGDAARPLSVEGRASFRELVRSLGARLEVERVLTSPARRARESAEILAELTGAAVEAEEELAAGRSGGAELLALLRRRGGGHALVGHNPELGEAIALALGSAPPVKAGTVAAFELSGEALAFLFLEAPPRSP